MNITGTAPMARCIGNAALFRRNGCGKVTAAASSSTADRASSVCSGSANNNNNKVDYYKVLSLDHSPAAIGADEIKRAYRRLVLRCHPDVCPPSRRAESTQFFLELRRAYETLSDPAERSRYDAELRRRRRRSSGQAAAASVSGGEFAFAGSRDVWEAQLSVLRARSERRHRATRGGRRHGVAHE